MKNNYRNAVFVVTYRKEKDKILYLVLKRKLHWKGWEFPKGGVKCKESALRGIKREIKEETGQSPIRIKDYKISGKYKYAKILEDRPNLIGQTYTLYSAEIKNDKIRLDKKEHSDYGWMDYKTALDFLTYPNQRRCLRIVNKDLTKSKK